MNLNLKESEDSACRLCGSDRSRRFGRNPDFQKSTILRCLDCGYMWSAPEPTRMELLGVYREAYRSIRQESPTPDYLAFMGARAEAQHEFITRAISRSLAGLRVLDIGCGAGSLLRKFENQGAVVTGFEPDRIMSETARGRLSANARVENVLFSPQDWHDEAFDLICMSHVLEHIPNPVDFLSGLCRVTRPGGYLFIEVPNENATSVQCLCKHQMRGLMHLVFFDETTLGKTFTAAGWQPAQSGTYGSTMSGWVAAQRRNHSLGWRAFRKAKRILAKAGLFPNAPPPAACKMEPFNLKQPGGKYLRAMAQKAMKATDGSPESMRK